MQRQLRFVTLFWCETLEAALCWRILIRQILLPALTCWMVFGDLAGAAGAALVAAGISWGLIYSSAGQNLIKTDSSLPTREQRQLSAPRAVPGKDDLQDDSEHANEGNAHVTQRD